jgi:hypothetical protein
MGKEGWNQSILFLNLSLVLLSLGVAVRLVGSGLAEFWKARGRTDRVLEQCWRELGKVSSL